MVTNITKYLPKDTFDNYYNCPQNFINKITKTNYKNIKYQNIEKKLKFDDIMFKIKLNYHKILEHIKFLSPILTSEIAIYKLYKYIKSGDLKMINNMRDIIFNLLITNITGTHIIKMLLNEIINDEKLDQRHKIKIINICKDVEYGVIKGRREINQFDNLLITIINIITS